MDMTAQLPLAAPLSGGGEQAARRPSGAEALAAWAAFLPRLLARTALMAVAGMLFWAVLPALFGWHATTVMSDSMAPRLLRGDIVVSLPIAGDRVQLGQVALFDDPDHAGRLRMHRVVAISPAHVLTTKGDANATADSSPVEPSAVHGVGVMRIPFIAYPIVWLHEGDLMPLALFGAGLSGVVALALPPGAFGGRRPRHRRPQPVALRGGVLVAGILITGTVAMTAISTPAHAAFTSTSATQTSTLAAAASFNADPATVTPTQLGVSAVIAGTEVVDAGVPVDGSGTITSPYYVCTTVHVTSTSGSPEAWQVRIDYALAPFNSSPPSTWDFRYNGAVTGRIVPGSDQNGFVDIAGAESVSANQPFGSSDWSTNPGQLVNTPVDEGQTALLYFCIQTDQSHLAPIVPATNPTTGAVNYTVSAPSLVGANGGAPTGDYACAAVTVTGYYPHFWVGYRFSVDWTALVTSAQASGRIDAATAVTLLAKHPGTQWNQSAGPAASAVLESTPATPGDQVYDVSSTGLGPSNGAITNGATVTAYGCTS